MRFMQNLCLPSILLVFSCLTLPTQAAPLPQGTVLTIDPGIADASTGACVSGSCFTFTISGIIAPASYFTMQPGADGGMVIGRNQAAGISPDAGELAGFTNIAGKYAPGSVYTTPYAYDPVSDATANIFDDHPCNSSSACAGKTMLGTWNLAGSPGRGAALGTASSQCTKFPSLYCPGVTRWELTPAGAPGIDGDHYILEYTRIFPDYLDGIYDHNFKFHLEGTIRLAKIDGVDLIASLVAAPDPATQNQPLTYTATVYNTGSQTASSVILNENLPATVSLISVAASQGSCSGSAVVSCALGDLASGASATVTISVLPASSGTLDSSVSVSSIESDANPANNTASNSLVVNAPPPVADVAVSAGASATTVKRLATVSYNFKVVNQGPDAAQSVFAYSILPASMTLVAVTGSQGTCDSTPYFVGFSLTTLVYCSLGDMPYQGVATMTAVVQPTKRGTFTTTVNVQSATMDNNTSNNQAKVSTRVN